ncbi:MAG: bifunctional hydroxymethylpyrimidine kinase/phosphomethylpyrimidine kinase [Pelistega sp.]|nr:bifunctional hydroxymethylpyrimidine kinase/phosphomethylpyrimidine kinase [Pelistega sp.]
MSEQLPPSVLFFNLHDPSYRAYLPAEAAHASQLQCQPLSVITAISIQDSSGIHEIYPLTPDAIEEQARCVLEDIRVQAIKVNHLYSLEALTVVAQVAADYEDVPMVLTLGAHYLASLYEDDVDQLLDSYLEVLAPHVHTVILDMTYAEQWLSSDSQLENAEDIINHCFAAGVEYCFLLSNTQDKELVYNSLYHTLGTVEHFTYDPPALRQAEFADIFSTSLSCLIAQQLPMSEACKQAIILSLNQFANQIPLGMGRPQVNRLMTYTTTYAAEETTVEDEATEAEASTEDETTVDETSAETRTIAEAGTTEAGTNVEHDTESTGANRHE